MNKKTIGILLIILVIFISIGAISAADTNETMLEEVSDTNIEATSVAVEKDNAISPESESGEDVEINVTDSKNEKSVSNELKVTSKSNEVLSASGDDVLKASYGCFLYNGNWYNTLEDAVDEACDNNGGTILIRGGTYGSDSDDIDFTISDGVYLTFSPYDSGAVIFDGDNHNNQFCEINDKNAHITFNSITFRNGGAKEGGAFYVNAGSLTVNNCIFDNNEAVTNIAGTGFGWGGAIFLDDDECSLLAKNCRFINNQADQGGGAVCAEEGSSASFEYCYFEGNKQNGEANDVYDKDGGTHSFYYCDFIGSMDGNFDYEVNYAEKSVTMTPDVNDDVNYAVLYKNGNFYDKMACNGNGLDTATFTDLEEGSYTIYMMKNEEKKYSYPKTTFTIIDPNFVLDDNDVFKTLSAAVNAIPNGGNGVITVGGGNYTDSANFNVQINNKKVTIRPKDSESGIQVTFSANSQNYLLNIGSNSQLIMEDIIITGKFSNAALIFTTNLESSITDCEFNNIKNSADKPGTPINAQNSKLELNETTFDLNGQIILKNTVANITECTFTNNTGEQGGAINADPSSDLTVTSSEFTRNDATEGGAIYANNLKIEDSTFMFNTAETGGAIYVTDNSENQINITSSVFDSNVATQCRNIFSKSPTRKFNLQLNEYDLNLTMNEKDASYGDDYILTGGFDWGSNLNNTFTLLSGTMG